MKVAVYKIGVLQNKLEFYLPTDRAQEERSDKEYLCTVELPNANDGNIDAGFFRKEMYESIPFPADWPVAKKHEELPILLRSLWIKMQDRTERIMKNVITYTEEGGCLLRVKSIGLSGAEVETVITEFDDYKYLPDDNRVVFDVSLIHDKNLRGDSPIPPLDEPLFEAVQKPPIGAMPRRFWIEDRIMELEGAINRYSKANLVLPGEWVAELVNLKKELILL